MPQRVTQKIVRFDNSLGAYIICKSDGTYETQEIGFYSSDTDWTAIGPDKTWSSEAELNSELQRIEGLLGSRALKFEEVHYDLVARAFGPASKIAAIKFVRTMTECSLLEAKQRMDTAYNRVAPIPMSW